jgi:hypothetical protein
VLANRPFLLTSTLFAQDHMESYLLRTKYLRAPYAHARLLLQPSLWLGMSTAADQSTAAANEQVRSYTCAFAMCVVFRCLSPFVIRLDM